LQHAEAFVYKGCEMMQILPFMKHGRSASMVPVFAEHEIVSTLW